MDAPFFPLANAVSRAICMSGVEEYSRTAVQSNRDNLILEHLRLVRHLAGKMSARLPPSVDRENLESAGMVGLIEAADRFEVEAAAEQVFQPRGFRGFSVGRLQDRNRLAAEIVDMQLAKHAYKASANVLRTADEMSKTLLDALA